MSELRGQVLRRDLVEVVAAIIDRVGPQQTPPAPKMHSGDHYAIAGRDILRGQQALRQQSRTPVGKPIDMAKPPDSRCGPWGCHHRAHPSLVEEIGDLFIRVGIDQLIDLLHYGGIGRAEHDTRLWQRQVERPRRAADEADVDVRCIALGERHVLDQQAQHALLVLHLCPRIAPEAWEVAGESHQLRTLGVVDDIDIRRGGFLVRFLRGGDRP